MSRKNPHPIINGVRIYVLCQSLNSGHSRQNIHFHLLDALLHSQALADIHIGKIAHVGADDTVGLALKQQLYGETATFLQDGIIQLTGLKIEIFRRGEVTARIASPECAYDPNRKRAASKDHIRIVTEKAVLTGDGFAWNGENEQFQIFKNAKVTLDGQMDQSLVAPQPAPAAEPAAEKE